MKAVAFRLRCRYLYLPLLACLMQAAPVQSDTRTTAHAEANAMIEQAEQLRQQSKRLGFEWTTTALLLEMAHRAIQQGDYKQALLRAQEAQIHAALAVRQAQHAQQHWQLEMAPLGQRRPSSPSGLGTSTLAPQPGAETLNNHN